MNISEQAQKLIQEQIIDWPLAKKNYQGLQHVKTRSIQFDGFELRVQFNPERIRSSAAKVDAKSIEARPCFLCEENLPPEQKGIKILENYTILVNPFPIFPEHLTIPHQKHTEQRIEGKFPDMLKLAAELDDFVVFYNGPSCGASAPDHFHFQAGLKGFMPIEKEFLHETNTGIIKEYNGVIIYRWENFIRNTISFHGNDKEEISSLFENFYAQFASFQINEVEPMLNILVYYDPSGWTVHVFPRKLHRPVQYFEKGKKQIILSPASVDLGGVVITPREEDFEKLTKGDITDILLQVCLDKGHFEDLCNTF